MTAEFIRKHFDLIHRLPDGAYCDNYEDALWIINCHDPAEIRACFPEVRFWKKAKHQSVGWWHSVTLPDGRKVGLNTYEAPQTCRAIEEEYETVEKVAIAFEERVVKKTRVRWECEPAVEVQT